MQTLFSKVIVLYTKAFGLAAFCVISIGCITLITGPVSRLPALILAITEFNMIFLHLSTLNCLLITKYLSIYHSSLLNNFSDEAVLRLLKAIIAFTTLAMNFVDNLPFDNTVTFQIYHYGYTKPGSAQKNGVIGLGLAAGFTMLILQIRIERNILALSVPEPGAGGFLSRIRLAVMKKTADSDRETDGNAYGYSMIVYRIVLGICLFIILVVLSLLFGNESKYKWIRFFAVFPMSGIIPPMFVMNHSLMRAMLFRMARNLIPNLPDRFVTVVY